MKKRMLLIGCMMACMLFVVCAMAEPIVPYIKDGSVTIIPVAGLKLDEEKTDYDEETGKWNIVIDSENTNWESVIQNGLDSMGVKLLEFSYHPVPDGAVSVASVGMHNDTTSSETYQWYQENLHYLNTVNSQQPVDKAGISLHSGYYNAATGLFFPQEYTDAMYSAFGFRWKMEDGSYKAEHSLYTLCVEPKLDSVSVPIPLMDSERFVTDIRIPARVENGKVSYISKDKLPEAMTLATEINAPAGTKRVMVNGYNRALQDTEDGGSKLVLTNELSAGSAALEESYVVIWMDENSNSTCERFTLLVDIGDPKPWPVYVDELKQYGENEATIKIDLWGKQKNKGVFHDITRLETFGELRLTADVGELIEAASKGADLTQNGTEFTIKPPKQAYYYRQFPAGATNIYDIDIERVCPLFNENEESVLPVKIEGNKVRMQYGYFSKQEVRLANGGAMTYYYCDNLLGKYAGTVDMFFWYDEDMKRIGQNYLIHTHDDIPMLNPVPLLTKEEDVADWKGKPAAVFLGDSSQFGAAELQAKRMPSSPNTHYYDLNLMANDAAVDLKGEKVVLYLPYPEGHSENSARKLNITVGHYDDNHNLIASDVYSMERGNLQFTPYGLRLEVSSFSPYVVSWEEAAALPQTGDDFPMALLLGVMTLSLCVMLRKRAKA